MFKYAIGLSLLFSSLYSSAQVEEVRRITQTLCSPEFHGRGYVNAGDSIASVFIADEFKKAGLTPLCTDYFQHFSFGVNRFPGELSFEHDERMLEIGKDILVDPGSPSYYGKLRPKLIHGLKILDEGALVQEIQSAISGNVYNSVVLDYSGIHPDTLKMIRNFKYELAQFMPVIELTESKFTWSVGRKQLAFPVLELQKEAYKDGAPIVVNLRAEFVKDYRTQNVVGYLAAKKRTKKTIVFTAHYDHLGRLGSDTYFPGANDNASGTAMIITLANYFREHPVDYNILFIAFAGEEAGLVGSKYYVDHPLTKLKDIEFLINLDIMGSGEDGITIVNGSIFTEHFDLMTAVNNEHQLLTQIKARGYAANSDHYWFTDAGVPAFFIYTMGTNKHYHDVFDTYEELTFVEFDDITRLLALFIERLPDL